ncbi:hypothetical protein IC802_00800 [Geobacillus sp. 44C]|nr:hypothetical protein IC802_00800 [Geobacillus sp. 44C]
MKKKLEQAVEYANKTNPSSRSSNPPSTSKKKKQSFKGEIFSLVYDVFE